jgi:hypothetical protein
MCVTSKHTVQKRPTRALSSDQGLMSPNRARYMNMRVRFRTRMKTASNAELHVKMKMVLVHRC